MQRRTDVVETPRHREVRRPYAVRTQFILHDTPMIKIIHCSITSDTLWIRNVRHRYPVKTLHAPWVQVRYTCDAVAYLAIKLRSSYVHAALLSIRRCMCNLFIVNQSCYECVANFLNMLKKRHTLSNPCELSDRAAYQLRKLSML